MPDRCSHKSNELYQTCDRCAIPLKGHILHDAKTHSIIKKWKSQDCFVRHVNGHTLDNRKDNLRVVSLKDAIDNISTWTVDWCIDLSGDELKLVQSDAWRKGLIFSTN